jgi:hypothetical protein
MIINVNQGLRAVGAKPLVRVAEVRGLTSDGRKPKPHRGCGSPVPACRDAPWQLQWRFLEGG